MMNQQHQQHSQKRRRPQPQEQQQHHQQRHQQNHQQQYLYPSVNNLDLPLPFLHGLVDPMVVQNYHHHQNYQPLPIENFVSEPLSSTRARVEIAPPPAAAATTTATTSSTNRKRVRLAQHHEVVALVEDMTEAERDDTWWRQEDFDDTKANVKQMCRGLRKQRRFSNCLTDAYESACGINCPPPTQNNNTSLLTTTTTGTTTTTTLPGMMSSCNNAAQNNENNNKNNILNDVNSYSVNGSHDNTSSLLAAASAAMANYDDPQKMIEALRSNPVSCSSIVYLKLSNISPCVLLHVCQPSFPLLLPILEFFTFSFVLPYRISQTCFWMITGREGWNA
jgi:hypothetical protein